MRKSLMLLLGLAVLGVDGYAAWKHFKGKSQEKLRVAADEALTSAQLTGVAVQRMDGRDVVLTGAVGSDALKRAAITAVEGVRGVRAAQTEALVIRSVTEPGPVVVRPGDAEHAFTIGWDGTRLLLEGVTLGQDFVDTVTSSARMEYGSEQVSGSFTVAPGTSPARVATTVSAVLTAIHPLSSATIRVKDGELRVVGLARDETTKQAVLALLSKHAQGPLTASFDVRVDAIDVAETDAGGDVGDTADAAIAVAMAPDTTSVAEADTTSVAEADTTPVAEADTTPVAEPDTTPIVAADTTPAVVADTTPAVVADTTPAVVADTTPAVVADTTPAVVADTTPAVVADTASPSVDAVPAVAPGSDGDTLTNERCEVELLGLVYGENRIQFNGVNIAPESEQTVADAAALMKRCPTAKFVVEGYTDAYGEPDAMTRLTRRWTAVVQDRLIELGIAEDRLSTRGYGIRRQKYPQAPRASRMLNRRIEFHLEGDR